MHLNNFSHGTSAMGLLKTNLSEGLDISGSPLVVVYGGGCNVINNYTGNTVSRVTRVLPLSLPLPHTPTRSPQNLESLGYRARETASHLLFYHYTPCKSHLHAMADMMVVSLMGLQWSPKTAPDRMLLIVESASTAPRTKTGVMHHFRGRKRSENRRA